MAQYLYEGEFQNPVAGVKVKLLLFSFQDENKVHFIYSPHLDLTGYGTTIHDAKSSFNIVFNDFIDYTLKKKTLSKVLSQLGWQLKVTAKHPRKVIAPSIISIIKDNKYVSELFDKYPVHTFHQEVGLPVLA
ncbi:MAG: hypothetical protein A2W85_09795 [Bacteroidetes bacterium GWF2_41_31]|nr:MAG: hypothetical protein A2W85_09795 [Bacteroidetes bacterium GWF2_41_31]